MAQCTAQSKQSGQQCKRRATPGRTVCRMHGGKTPTGAALPQFTTGRYSKYLPVRLLDRYHAATVDPDLLNLSAEIALTDSRLAELLGRIDKGESGRLWAELHELWDLYRKGDPTVTQPQITLLIQHGLGDYATWGEIANLIQQRRALVESERKRLVELQQMIRADEALTLIRAIAQSIQQHVSNPDELAAIGADLARLLNSGSATVLDGARVR